MLQIIAEATVGDFTAQFVAILIGVGGLLGGFYAFANNQMKQARDERTKERESERIERSQERKDFSDALRMVADAQNLVAIGQDKVAAATHEVAIETRKGADGARLRNGHLAELIIQSKTDIQALADRNLQAYQNIKQQNVEKQVVQTETVQHMEQL